jgi:hypothetical protein
MIDSSMTKPDSMIFVDKCLADDLINVIEKMVNYHIDKNYKEVRNIIIGYDSKNGEWRSRYGESLEKKISGLEQTITYTSPSTYSFFLNTESFTKQGMIFYEDEIYNNVRLQLDESMKRVLDVMFTLSDRVIEYRHIIDIIITEWNLKNIKNSMIPIKIDTDPDICGDLYFHQLEVRENAWREFRSISRFKGLMLRDAFKQAVIEFLGDRVEILKENVK